MRWTESCRGPALCRRDERILLRVFALGECTCIDEMCWLLVDIGSMGGFEFVCYQDYRVTDGAPRSGRTLSNYPESWQSCYRERTYLRIDPIVQHALSSLVPLTWCDRIFVTTEQRAFRDESRMYGLSAGVSFPAHNRYGDVACVSFVRQAGESDNGGAPCEIPIWGALVANLMLDTSRRLGAVQSGTPCLSARELEILRWVAEGKSSWDISQIVSLTEHGVLHHIRNVMKKFDVPTRRQAVLMASRLGML